MLYSNAKLIKPVREGTQTRVRRCRYFSRCKKDDIGLGWAAVVGLVCARRLLMNQYNHDIGPCRSVEYKFRCKLIYEKRSLKTCRVAVDPLGTEWHTNCVVYSLGVARASVCVGVCWESIQKVAVSVYLYKKRCYRSVDDAW